MIPLHQTKRTPILIAISAILFGIGGLIFYTFPLIQYAVKAPIEPNQYEDLNTWLEQDTAEAQNVNTNEAPATDIEGNRIIIEKIGVDMPVLEGSAEALEQGAWHYTDAAPGEEKNIVIAGHRFKFLPPSSETFYLLDKLETGDEIKLAWEGKLYTYAVDRTQVVTPTQTEVLDEKGYEELTLITCTPLFSTKNRLIISAKPI